MILPRRIIIPAAIGWLSVIGWVTLRSNPAMREIVLTTPWHCLLCGDAGATDFLLNLILFAPLGLLARAANWRLLRIALLAVALSTCIELIQGHLLIGRDATLGDVISNGLGAVIGWLALGLTRAVAGSPGLARRVAMVVLTCQAAVWLATGFGIRPALDGPAPWVGRFIRIGDSQDPFSGTLQEVRLNGIPVTMEPMSRLPRPGDSLDLAVALTRTSEQLPPRSASLVRMVDGRPNAFLRVSQVRRGLDVQVQLRASALRFRTPSWRFSDALGIPVGQPWQYRWRWHRNTVEMTSAPAKAPEQAGHFMRAMSIGLGWALMHPFVYVIDEQSWQWTLLWIASWFLMLGWSSSWAGRRFAIGLAVTALLLFVAAGALTSLPVSAPEVAAAVVGWLLGCLLGDPKWRRPAKWEPGGA